MLAPDLKDENDKLLVTTSLPDDETLLITFVRPEIRNPLSIVVQDFLIALVDDVALRPDIKNVVFTGQDDVFAAGANLAEIAKITPDTVREFALRGQTMMNKIASVSPLTIAAVNGYCFGGALDLALSCDMRIATPNATFCHPGVGLGIMTGWGGTQRLPRLIGEAKSLEMLLTARQVPAREALQIGLIDRVTENLFEEIAQITESR